LSDSSYSNAKRSAIASVKPSARQTALRVVLLADGQALHNYGPVLRRLSVGLIDEVAELSLLCIGHSNLLDFVPSPPVRLFTETRTYYETTIRTEVADRKVSISSPKISLIDFIRPQRRDNRLALTLSPYRPTLLHALSERQARLARHLSKQLQIPYIVSILSQTQGRLSISANRCGQILPCFSSIARKIRQHHPELSSRVRLLPIGTHVNSTPCCFAHDQRTPQLFCSADFEHGKGLFELINSAKRLTKMGYSFHLTLSGKGTAERELRRRVRLIWENDAYKMVLNAIDIFIQPWPEKTWRPQLLEAMSVGNAVAASADADSDIIIDGKTALTFEFNDEQAITKTLHNLLKDHQYARSIAGQCQNFLRKHFLASQMINRLAQAYRQAVQLKIDQA